MLKPLFFLPVLACAACIAGEEAKRPELEPPAPAGGAAEGDDLRAVLAETPVTRAVDHALRYLKRMQLDDGSWRSGDYDKNTGITSLALMAFLARGHEPGRGIYGDVIERGITWILDSEKGGLIHRETAADLQSMYSHGISTLLLGEVMGMVDEDQPAFERLSLVHRKAVELILRAQALPKSQWQAGGWRYTPDALQSDLSVSGWQLLALRAAQEAGLPVPKKPIELGVSYVLKCALPDGSFAYQPAGRTTIGLTGTGILTLELCAEHATPEALRGGEWLLEHPLEWNQEWFFYAAYYASQAMYQLGERYWEAYQPIVQTLLLEKQAAEGSWPYPPAAAVESRAGPIYATAMAVLALSVEFRYLPIYQR